MKKNLSRIPWFLVGVLTLVALVLAGCGADDADRASSGPSGDGSTIGDAPPSDDFDAAPEAPTGNTSGEGSDSSGGGGVAPLPSTLDRKIIRTATLSVQTDAVAANFENVANIAEGAGGFVSSSTFGNTGEEQTASITIRVPASAYTDTVNRLRKLGAVTDESSNANDVTEQFTDLESRLRNLRAAEQRYLEFLNRAGNITEVLTVQDRINFTRAEIEQIEGRIQLLDNQTALATITVHLVPPGVSLAEDKFNPWNPLEVAGEAFAASILVLLGLATVAIAIVAFSWWLVPLAALGFALGRKQLRSRNEPPAAPGSM